jgi:2-amino-4-hydroxy-6-hydroxymethyldihydropteridine diphosphokinase
MGTLALIGLGSNVGDRKAHLDAAVAALAETPGVTVRGVSSYHETAPVGGPPGQGAFLNAAAAIETTLDPRELLATLQAIEARAGRVRDVRWAERTLDLDLLLFGNLILDSAELTVPHPRMAIRRFVLAPLVEVAPSAVDPFTGRTISELLVNLDAAPTSS